MSQENVEIVRRATDYFNETGVLGPLELHDPEVTFTTRGDIGGAETYTGHRGLVEAMANFREVWAQIDAHIIELVGGDDAVVSVMRFELRSQVGVDLKVEEASAIWLRDGKIHRIEQHATRRDALEAVGLRE
jgi:ketosteroid isomerase-like protein